MTTDIHQTGDPLAKPPVSLPVETAGEQAGAALQSVVRRALDDQKTRLWALSYERTSKVVCCENCGTTTNISGLLANPEAKPERRQNDLLGEGGGQTNYENGAENSQTKCIDNRYDIIRPLGQGGMGAVYLVHDKILHKQMAMKMLRDDLSTAEGAILLKRFEQEAQSALAMTHVNVVAAYGQGRHTNGAPYLVMDYIEGQSLGRLIQSEGVLEVHEALAIFIQVCEALAHSHTKNLIHRDIKPANILLQNNDLVKLVDFGIAKTLPLFDFETMGLTQTSEILGSPAYMSPEHCLGEGVDERSDIYSLGCVIYEALTGQPPVTSRHPIKAIMEHIKGAPAPIARRIKIADQQSMEPNFDYEQYRKSIQSVVMRCLEKSPADRYQSADELRLDLEQLNKNIVPVSTVVTRPRQTSSDTHVAAAADKDRMEEGRMQSAITLVILTLVLLAIWIARVL